MGKNSYFILLTGERKMQYSLTYWEELSEGRCLVLSCFKDSGQVTFSQGGISDMK